MTDMEMKQRLFNYLEKEKIKIPSQAFDGMSCIEINSEFIKYELTIKTKPLLNLVNDSYYGFFIKETETDYIVGFILPSSGEFFTDEYDRSSDAFALYSSIYGDKIMGIK